MPKLPKFKPRKVTENRNLPWTISVPADLKALGVKQKFFATKALATVWADELKVRWSRREEEAQLQSLLPVGVSLRDAVEFYNGHHRKQMHSISFDDAVGRFLESRADHAARTQEEIRMMQRRFEGKFGLLSEITTSQIQGQLDPMTFNNRKRWRRLMGTLFRWSSAPQRGWCTENPAAAVELGKAPIREISVLSNSQVVDLLTNAEEMTPFFALACFTGARPTELQRATWEDINWEEKHILIRATKSGVSRKRYIQMEPNLIAWLHPYKKDTGLIFPEADFHGRHRKARDRAKITEWPEDICRHTFASNHLTQFSDLTRLMIEMNHTTTKMLFAHYHRHVPKREATQFWDIYPEGAQRPAPKKGKSSGS